MGFTIAGPNARPIDIPTFLAALRKPLEELKIWKIEQLWADPSVSRPHFVAIVLLMLANACCSIIVSAVLALAVFKEALRLLRNRLFLSQLFDRAGLAMYHVGRCFDLIEWSSSTFDLCWGRCWCELLRLGRHSATPHALWLLRGDASQGCDYLVAVGCKGWT